MMQKKGVIEFSITTIIIVIIGVIILAIAIPWLTGTLRQAGGLTDVAFDSALRQLQGEPTIDDPVVLSQDSFTLNPGEQAALVVRYLNKNNEMLIFEEEARDWFESDGSAASGKVYDWRVVLTVPPNQQSGTYFARAKVGDKSVPIAIQIK